MGQILFCYKPPQSRNPSRSGPNVKKTTKQTVEQMLRIPQKLKISASYYESFDTFHKQEIPLILRQFQMDEEPLILNTDNLNLTEKTTSINALSLIKQHILAADDCPIKQIIQSYFKFLRNLFEIPQNIDHEVIDSSTVGRPDNSISMTASQYSTFDQYGKQNALYDLQSQQSLKSNNSYQNLHYRTANQYESIRQVSPRIENSRVRSIEEKLLKNPGLSTILLVQVNDMIKCIRFLILSYYKNQLCQYFNNMKELNEFQTRESFFERIEQSLILSNSGPLMIILHPIIRQHYFEQKQYEKQNKSKMQNKYPDQSVDTGITNVQEPILDITLIPPSNRTSNEFELRIEESEEQDSSFQANIANQDQMFKYNNDNGNLPVIEENDEEVKTQGESQPFTRQSMLRGDLLQMIQRSELVSQQTKLPYQETFPLLERLIIANKPYQKFKYIQKLDLMIVQIFLRSRSSSQISKLMDHISAEDSKTDILFFILYKFWKQNKADLEQTLYVYLKFMHDFDAILHYDLKFVYCPAFVRFYSILDMLVGTEI